MKKSSVLSIALYPPQKIRAKAINIAGGLRGKGAVFALDGKSYFPHINIYMAEFPEKNLRKIMKLLRSCVRKIKPFSMTASSIEAGGNGYVGVKYKISKRAAELQRDIIRTINPLREGLVYDAKGFKFSKPQLRNLKLYGYDNVGRSFHPHLSLARLKQPAKNVDIKTAAKDFLFTAGRIALFRTGKYFTCRKILKVFNLGVDS
ncbi:MAG: 2'-5' RNA ligase family protein [Candidatus Liptonbacteria bacterium]|nr:2'-5' RNA ligase family protein [Candidatus Liptonbacteria bacterium]